MKRTNFRFSILIIIFICIILTTIFTPEYFGVIYSKNKDLDDYSYNKIHTNQPQNSSPGWWNPSYNYRIAINITNIDTIVLPKGYSVNISVNTVSLISTGKLREDGNDLRIAYYDSIGNTWLELDRVNETNFNDPNTQIWFKTQEQIDSGLKDINYYLYYGYPEAINPPVDKNKVYDFYEDFTQDDGPAEGWSGGSTWWVTNNEYRDNSTGTDVRSILNSYTVENASIEVRIKNAGTSFGVGILFRYSDADNFYCAGIGYWDREVAYGECTAGIWGTPVYNGDNESNLNPNQWYDLKVNAIGSNYKVYLDGVLRIEDTNNSHLGADYIGFLTWASVESYFDNLKIRLLVSSEPTTTLGIEEKWSPSIKDFKYYKKITIDHTQVSGSSELINFPLLISLIDSDLHKYAQSDGDDIVFYDGNEFLAHEIEVFNQTYNSTHAQLAAWVRIPSLSSTIDTMIFMYYGNSAMHSFENATGVWNDNYRGVWHLKEDPSLSGPQIKDSTSNSYHGTSYGSMTSNNQVKGQIGGSVKFDGLNDYINLGPDSGLKLTDAFTIEAWYSGVYNTAVDTRSPIYTNGFAYSESIGVRIEGFHSNSGRDARIAVGDGTTYDYIRSDYGINDNIWTHLVGTYDGSTLKLYINGTKQIDELIMNIAYNTNNATLGINLDYTVQCYEGLIDEFRILNESCSADWIVTEYNNQYDPSTFYNVSSAMKVYIPSINDFSYYKEITIDNTKVSGSSNLLNFPVLISIFDSDLHDHTQVDGDDIAFYNGTEWLDYELELYNQSYSLTQAQLVAWIRIPSLSPTMDTKIYIYYGNSTMSSQENPPGVWDDNYVAIYHLNDAPSGNAKDVFDSTFNNNDGNVNGSMDETSLVNSKIGKGFKLDGFDDLINVSKSSSLDSVSGEGTLSLWINWVDSSKTGLYQRIMTTSNRFNKVNPIHRDGFEWSVNQYGDNFFYPWGGDGDNYNLKLNPFTDGIWHNLIVTLDYSIKNVTMYLDGMPIAFNIVNVDTNWTQLAELENWLWGASVNITQLGHFEGNFDEIRVSNIARSADWIATEYNNHNDPNNFYSIGTENLVGEDTLAPEITISSPNPNDLFGSNAPNYDLTVTDANLDSIWYSFNGGITNSTPVSASGTINQAMWSALGNGTVTIRFYANDTLGNTDFKDVIVRKDISKPSIAINSPNPNELFGGSAPDYDLTVTDANLDSIWYSFNGGITNSTPVSASGTIDQAMWSALGNGTVTIRFYANDTLGNTDFEEVIVRKDIILPFVDITTPSYDGAQTGGFIISISGFGYGTGSNIVSMYINDTRWGDGSQKPQLDPSGSQSGAFIFSNNTYIEPGFYWIEINITDTAGNFNTSVRYFEVIIEDLTPPILTISSISPDPTNSFTEIIVSSNENLKFPPLLNITLPNNSIVYRPMILIAALTWCANYSVNADGIYTVRVNGTDDANNVGYIMDTFEGDITRPSIIINNPNLNDLIGTNAPEFDVTISDSNGISSQWYTIDDGTNNYTFVGSTGTIDQLTWSGQGNGTVVIRFYANDTAGNIWWEEVTVRKDIIEPSIIITSPNPYELFGTITPTFDVSISDSSGISSQWYTIDDGTNNYTFVGSTGTIDQLAWSGQGNGTVIIRFYANDTAGNIWWEEVTVRKDNLNPIINIIEPEYYDLFGNLPPTVVINVIDLHLDEVWYQLDNGTIITSNTTWTGSISQSVWDQVGNGTVIIRFYANDTLSNLGTAEVIVYKDILIPIININNPGSNELYSSIAPNFTISISGSNLNTTWYTLNDGLINYTFTGLTGVIDQTVWDAQVDGIVTIKFFINNTLGFLGLNEIAVRKDTLAPQITINLPSNNTYYGLAPIINILATDANLDAIWYRINTMNLSLGNNINQQLDVSIWNSLPDGEFYVYIYANDSIGHLNDFIFLILNKDTIAPSAPLLINFPQGEVSGTLVFEWQAGSDPSGISKYRLIIDTEANPFATPGFVFEINITTNYYEYTGSFQSGTYYFCLYQIDGTGHQSSASTGSFIIKSTIPPSHPSEFPLWIIFVIVGAAIGGIVGTVVLKKSKSKKIKPLDVSQKKSVSMQKLDAAEKVTILDNERLKSKNREELTTREKFLLDNIKILEENQNFTKAAEVISEVIIIEELLGNNLKSNSYRQKQIDIAIKGLDYLKNEYEKESKKAALSGDYSKSLELYKESQMISENLKVYLESQESSDSIEDIAIQSEVISEPLGDISIVYTSINDLLTKYFDEIGIKYYSNPQLYNNLQKQVHGLILNEDKSLIENLDTRIKEKIKAIQIIYTDNVSSENVKNLCKEFQNSYMMLIIVGIAWEESIGGQIMKIPKDKQIKYFDNIKIIYYDLFSKLLGLSDNYEIAFNEIISLYNNSKFDILQQSHKLSKIKLHETEELLKDLKEKGLIKKSLNDYFKM